MDTSTKEQHLCLARDYPNITCSQIPFDILEASTNDPTEPSDFIKDFLEAGHRQWLISEYGSVRRSEQQIKNAVVVLWVRATRLYAIYNLNAEDPDWEKPFFSDAGLY